jgi:hypothetical protein
VGVRIRGRPGAREGREAQEEMEMERRERRSNSSSSGKDSTVVLSVTRIVDTSTTTTILHCCVAGNSLDRKKGGV